MIQFAKRYPGLSIFALALVARLVWIATLGRTLSFPDEEEFVDVARHIAAGYGYVSSSYRANPTLAAYLGVVFSVFGESFEIARVGQCLFGALTCVLVYRTATLLAGPSVGILSGVLLALYPPHIFLSGVFYVECLAILLGSLSLYLAVRGALQPGIGGGILCGVACGGTVLTRPIFVLYLPCLCLAWLYAAWPQWRRQVVVCGALVLSSVAVVLPWSVRNYRVFHRVVPVATGFYTLLWQGNNELADGGPDDRFLFWRTPMWTERLQKLPANEQAEIAARYAELDRSARDLNARIGDRYLATDTVLKPVVLEYMRAHPGRIAKLFLRKLITLYSAFTDTFMHNDLTSPPKRLIAAFAFYPLLGLALAGAWFGRQESRGFAVLYMFILSMSVAYALIAACTRYRLPIDPYLIVFAALALVRAAEALAKKGKSQKAKFKRQKEWLVSSERGRRSRIEMKSCHSF